MYTLDTFSPDQIIADNLAGFDLVKNQIDISINDALSAQDRFAYWTFIMLHYQLWRHPMGDDGMQKYPTATTWVDELVRTSPIGKSTVWRDYTALSMFVAMGYTIDDFHQIGITRIAKVRQYLKLDPDTFLPVGFRESAVNNVDPGELVAEALNRARDNAAGDLMTNDFDIILKTALKPGVARIWIEQNDGKFFWHYEPNDGSIAHIHGKISWKEDESDKSFHVILEDNPPNVVRYWLISRRLRLQSTMPD